MVRAIMIVELMGRPAEHAAEALNKYMAQLDSRKYVTDITKTFSEPKKIEDDTSELYTCHCEVEFSCETLSQVITIVFDFMPASIEIVDPAKLSLPSHDMTDMLNTLSGRLHRYDDVVKAVQNNQTKMVQEMKIAHKLLLDHKIIDKQGKVLSTGKKQSAHSTQQSDAAHTKTDTKE